MTRNEFERLAASLKRGDNSGLALLQPFMPDCTGMLRAKSNGSCTPDNAYDIWISSVLAFRKNVLRDKVEYGNIKAYLQRICWNTWLAQNRSANRQSAKAEDIRREVYSNQDDYDPYTNRELSIERSDRIKLIIACMNVLSEKCRTILRMAIMDEIPMAEIASQLGLANANVAKVTKARCYKYLLREVKSKMEHDE